MLIDELVALGYPRRVLYLSLLIHLAPRVLESDGVQVVDPIVPMLSIVAGLFDSTAMAQGFLFRTLARVRSASSLVEFHSHVDDIAVLVDAPSLHQLRSRSVQASVDLILSVQSLGLKVSPKTVAIAASPKFARSISEIIKSRTGVQVASSSRGVDLGSDFAPGKSRVVSSFVARVIESRPRVARVVELVKQSRKSSCLYTTGLRPSTMYNITVAGLSLRNMQQLRTDCATSTGINSTGRCRFSAISLVFGSGADPAEHVPQQSLESAITFILKRSVSIDSKALHKLCQQAKSWRTVSGLLAAAIFYVHNVGWKWLAPFTILIESQYWYIDAYNLPLLIQSFSRSASF